MKKIFKYSITLMLIFMLACSVAFVAAPEAEAADPGTTVGNPIVLTPDVFYTKYWTKDNDHLNCYCKIDVASRGYVTFTIVKPLDDEGEAGTFGLTLFDSNGEVVWKTNTEALQNSFSDYYVYKIGLNSGVYYMNIDPSFYVTSGTISTTFKYSFTADSYWEVEPNGDRSVANPITVGTMYNGVYTEEHYDTVYSDYYSVYLTANKKYELRIDNYAKLSTGSTMVKIYDTKGNYEYCYDRNIDRQDGTVYIWYYTPIVSGTYYVALENNGADAPVEYKIGVYEYVCEHRPSKDATCSSKAVCSDCGQYYGDYNSSSHSYTNSCDTSCDACGATRKTTHSYNSGAITTAATCKKAGVKTYTCSVCKSTKTESIAKTSHTYKTVTTKATLSNNGKTESKCSVCGYVKSSTTIYYPKTVKLSATSYTYNGKEKNPSVTVKDSKGNTLTKDTDYTVKYEDGRKNPGKYTVTITFKGKYEGTKTLNFKIAPKATSKITATTSTSAIKLTWKKVTGADGYVVYKYNSSTKKYEKYKSTTKTALKVKDLKAGTKYKFTVRAYKKDDGTIWGENSATFTTSTKPAAVKLSSVSAGTKKLTAKWSKVTGASGYVVEYSTKKDFSSKKTVTVKDISTVKATVSKLTSGKTYYVRVRAYKTVDGAKVYGAYSSVKSVKVK